MPKARRPSTVAARLEALYAEIPRIDCQGLCWDSCGPIMMTRAEHRRIETSAGVDIPDGRSTAPATCVALTMLRRCAVYELRPMICRVWGVVETMPCNHGCRPDRYLTDAECYELLARAYDIAGETQMARRLRSLWATPDAAARTAALRKLQLQQYADGYALRERLAQRNGTALYVTGRGKISRTKPT